MNTKLVPLKNKPWLAKPVARPVSTILFVVPFAPPEVMKFPVAPAVRAASEAKVTLALALVP